jgi:hypothetical protein
MVRTSTRFLSVVSALLAFALAAAPAGAQDEFGGSLLPSPLDEGRLDDARGGLSPQTNDDPVEVLLETPPGALEGLPFPEVTGAQLLDETAPTFSSGEWIFSGGWYFQEDVVVMQKAELEEQVIASDFTDPLRPLLLRNTSDPPTFEPGTRITLGKIYGRDVWNRDHMIEFRFFGMFDWPSQAQIVSTIPGRVDTTLGRPAGDVFALFNSDSQRYIERSTLDSFDLNARMRTRGSRDRMVLQHDGAWIRHQTNARIWSCYTGFTTFFIDDQFDLLATGTNQGRFVVSTNNDLFGVHFGGEYIEQAAVWNWGVRGRLGGLANFATRKSSYTSQFGAAAPTTRAETVDKDNLTFLIEGGIFASLQIHPNATLRVGYDILYLTGLAQAIGNNNLPVGNFSPMEVNDAALYHGGSLGFTMVW